MDTSKRPPSGLRQGNALYRRLKRRIINPVTKRLATALSWRVPIPEKWVFSFCRALVVSLGVLLGYLAVLLALTLISSAREQEEYQKNHPNFERAVELVKERDYYRNQIRKIEVEKRRINKKIGAWIEYWGSPLGEDFKEALTTVCLYGDFNNCLELTTSVAVKESTAGKASTMLYWKNLWGLRCYGDLIKNCEKFSNWEDAITRFLNYFTSRGYDGVAKHQLPAINNWYASSKVWGAGVTNIWGIYENL